MTVSTGAMYVMRPQPTDALAPENPPIIMWGQGTPDGDAEPWKSAQKGSLWIQVNATDDYPHMFAKVDEGSDDADWVQFPVMSDSTGILNNVLNATSASGSAAYFH